MVTSKDVARVAGVSVTTVSHVINGTRHVSAETRAAVEAAIAATGYTPNTLARSLVTASTQSIGVALSAISSPYFGDLVHTIESTAARAGYMLLVADTHDDTEQELRVVRALRQRRVDGMLLAASAQARPALDDLAAANVPVVLIDRLVDDRFDQVGTENVAASAAMVEHLIDAGHSRIGMVTGLRGLATTRERREGYRLALRRRGLPDDDALMVDGASDVEPARLGVHDLLSLSGPPTALFVGNNRMTIGALRALREAGLRVPQDMAMVVFDDFEWADLLAPRLTAVAQPLDAIAQKAVRLLLARIADPERPPRTHRIRPTLVHRDSCGCPSLPLPPMRPLPRVTGRRARAATPVG